MGERAQTSRFPAVAILLAGTIFFPLLSRAQDPSGDSRQDDPTPPIHISDRGIQVVRSASGLFFYTYPETIEALDPYADYTSQIRITDPEKIRQIESLVTEKIPYTHEIRKRCYPVWQYGIEFRKSPTVRRTFLFSFRCGTMKLLEEGIYRDFESRKLQFEKIFQEIQKSS